MSLLSKRRSATVTTSRPAAIAIVASIAVALTIATFGPALVFPVGADGNEAPSVPLAARSLTAGFGHTCAIDDDGGVRCWGANGTGQLGAGDAPTRGDDPGEMEELNAVDLGSGSTGTAVAAGWNHTCARLDDGTVKCWGDNESGQLGVGDTTDRGSWHTEMGDALPSVDLGTGRTAVAITAGFQFSCVVLDDGAVRCWGRNEFGQLGIGDTSYRGDGSDEMGDNLPTVDLGTGRTATAVTAGLRHACAILHDGNVKCWGANWAGQLGYGDTTDRGDGPGEMGDTLPAVDLGAGRTAIAISAGEAHTCAVLDNGDAKCWGASNRGQLGYGDAASRGNDAAEMGESLPPIDLGTGRSAVTITTGSVHTCALLDDATVKCWGRNLDGRLGLGDTVDRGGQTGDMGDDLPAVDVPLMTIAAGFDPSPPPTPTPTPPPAPTPTATPEPTPTGPPTRTCGGRAATIVGGPEQEVVLGTNRADVIVTRNPDGATIRGRGGDDLICGGAGDDHLEGGRGRDSLWGGPAQDRLVGGAGTDSCNGGPGRDRTHSCERTARAR